MEILERIRNGERVKHYETRRQRKDGRIIDILLSVSPVWDNTGRLLGASKVTRDITAKKLGQVVVRKSCFRSSFRPAHLIPAIASTAWGQFMGE